MHCSAHKHCRLGLAHGATRSSRQWGSLRLSESQRQGCRTSASKKSQKIVAQQPMLAPRYPLAFCQPDFGFHPHKAASSLQHHSGVSRRHQIDGRRCVPTESGTILWILCRTQEMQGDPFGLLLQQRIVFMGGEVCSRLFSKHAVMLMIFSSVHK